MSRESVYKSALFKNMSAADIDSCLEFLSAYEKKYKKGSTIMHAGTTTDVMGLVLSGSVTIESNDIWGNCTILSSVPADGFFAETYAILQNEIMLVDVRANEDCSILFLNVNKLFTQSRSASIRENITRNLLMISSHKNLTLSGRSFHISQKSVRGRILSYLNTVSLQKHSTDFEIPFNRQQMADYLNLERTNMSKELSKMQKDGIIRFKKIISGFAKTEFMTFDTIFILIKCFKGERYSCSEK